MGDNSIGLAAADICHDPKRTLPSAYHTAVYLLQSASQEC